MENPRLKDVAQAAGVSVSSASYALRGSHQVSAATRQKVVAAAQRLGYRKNPMVAAWMQQVRKRQKSAYQGTIAFVHALHEQQDLSRNRTFAERAYAGVRARAQESGFRLEEFSLLKQTNSGRTLDRMLFHRGIEGIVIGPIQAKGASLNLDWSRYAPVAIGYTFSEAAVPRVSPNGFEGMKIVMENLHRLGYRRPAFFLYRDDIPDSVVRRFVAAYQWHCLERLQRRPFPVLQVKHKNLEELKKWIVQHQPDVVIGIRAEEKTLLERLGYTVPKELGYVALESDGSVPVAHLDQQAFEIGKAALDEVAHQLQINSRGLPEVPHIRQIPGRWVMGASIRGL